MYLAMLYLSILGPKLSAISIFSKPKHIKYISWNSIISVLLLKVMLWFYIFINNYCSLCQVTERIRPIGIGLSDTIRPSSPGRFYFLFIPHIRVFRGIKKSHRKFWNIKFWRSTDNYQCFENFEIFSKQCKYTGFFCILE